MKQQKISRTEIASFLIFIGLVFSIMGWYESRTRVPDQKPHTVTRQYSM